MRTPSAFAITGYDERREIVIGEVVRRILLMMMAVLTAWSYSAIAQEQNVQTLLSTGYTVVGVIPSPAGPGLFLQKNDKLVFCIVAETHTSPDVATRYCKPVY